MTQTYYLTDSYCRSLEAEVVKCAPVAEGFEVILDRTILYPEGGGQPSDRGTVGGHEVRGMEKRADGTVVHLLDDPVSGAVVVEVDWPRRYDHMQQHTAQHLLTALAADRFHMQTTAFHLGETRSDVELDCQEIPSQKIGKLEDSVNERIRSGLSVTHRIVDAGELKKLTVRTRGLPGGLSGEIRLVEIEGIDRCTCGGTHVANTAELQVFKLLDAERLRGGTRLFFAAGGRVTRMMQGMMDRERRLNRLLSCGPDRHGAMVEKLLDETKAAGREKRRLLSELAEYRGRELARGQGPASYHHPQGDMDFLKAVAAAFRKEDPEHVILLTGGGKEGVFLLAGPDEILAHRGPDAAELLGGRGGGRGGVFQGKYGDLTRLGEALKLLTS